MQKIRLIRNAVTFVSDLTVEEIKTLQKQCPMALALEEPTQDGGTTIVCYIEYSKEEYGMMSERHIKFVDATEDGKACLTVLVPANLENKQEYLYNTYATATNYLKTIERKAKKALEDFVVSKDNFAEEFIDLDAEETVAEALEEVNIIVKAQPAKDKIVVEEPKKVKKGGKK